MGIRQFQEEIQLEKKVLHAIISIYHQGPSGEKSFVNEQLEKIQIKLKSECEDYEKIRVTYVFETPYLDVKVIEDFKEDTQICYKEPYILEKGKSKLSNGMHKLQHVCFLSLVLMEEFGEKNKENVENRWYMITDEKFPRNSVREIVAEQDDQIVMHPRFAKLCFETYLIKTKKPESGGDLLERYFACNGNVIAV